MHPEIRREGPGSCPICGMALEPETGGADEGGELADMTRRLWISAALAAPVVVLDMAGHFGFAPLARRLDMGAARFDDARGALGRVAVL